MKNFIFLIVSIILLPLTILFFLLPIFVYFIPFMNIQFVLVTLRILLILWFVVFLSSITFLSSYCGFLCPITKLFTITASITKNNNILKHRFPKLVGVITQLAWLAGMFYVYLRLLGNIFGFLHREEIFYHMELILLLSIYGVAAILLNSRIGKDELGHYLCPLAPFTKLGIELNKLFKLPGFRIVLHPSLCKKCGQCNKICTYQNNVMAMVKEGEINYKLCSNCGKCISVCKNKAIKREWTKFVNPNSSKI